MRFASQLIITCFLQKAGDLRLIFCSLPVDASDMAEKSTYGERFSFENPLCKLSANRSTRNRAKKRRALDDSGPTTDILRDNFGQEQDQEEPVYTAGEDHHCSEYVHQRACNDHISCDPTDGVGVASLQIDVEETEQLVGLAGTQSDTIDRPLISDEFSDLFFQPESDEEESGSTQLLSEKENVSSRLYEGSALSVCASNVLIMKYKLKHNLTQDALGDLLSLLRIHCPSPNECPPSVYKFRKHFGQLKYPINSHHFCSSCLWSIDDLSQVQSCPNPYCSKDVMFRKKAVSSFIEVPIEPQLKTFFERK